MGKRGEATLVHTPKEVQLQLLLRVNQAVEATLRREEVPFRWNTIQVQWGARRLVDWPSA